MSYGKNGLWYFTDLEIQTAKENGVCLSTLKSRVNVCGWDIARAITTPPEPRKRTKEYNFSREEFLKAESNGVSKNLLYMRVIKMNWDKDVAMITPPSQRRE